MAAFDFTDKMTQRDQRNITRGTTSAPDYTYDLVNNKDSFAVRISNTSPTQLDTRSCASICPAIRSVNPTGLLLYQAFRYVAFANQISIFSRKVLVLDKYDGNADLSVAVWLLEPYGSAQVSFILSFFSAFAILFTRCSSFQSPRYP